MNYSIPFGLRIDQDTFNKLKKLARAMGRDKSEVIRILICDADVEAYSQSSHRLAPKNATIESTEFQSAACDKAGA